MAVLKHRSVLKWLHWLTALLILWFFLVEPEDVDRLGALALATHAGMGVLLGLVTAFWTGMFLAKGLAGRPGPKLPGWAKRLHNPSHLALQYGVPIMVATGAATGLAAPYVIRAFGLLPISPGIGTKTLHGLLEDVHEIAFNLLLLVVIFHITFHLWRHFGLRDNALRIITPRALHRYL